MGCGGLPEPPRFPAGRQVSTVLASSYMQCMPGGMFDVTTQQVWVQANQLIPTSMVESSKDSRIRECSKFMLAVCIIRSICGGASCHCCMQPKTGICVLIKVMS